MCMVYFCTNYIRYIYSCVCFTNGILFINYHAYICIYSKLCGEACHIPLRCAEVEKKASKDVRYTTVVYYIYYTYMAYDLCDILLYCYTSDCLFCDLYVATIICLWLTYSI